MRQTTSGVNDLLATYANYALHKPQITTDAAGQATALKYNTYGQVLTLTNAKSEATTIVYDADHRIASSTGAVAGSVVSYTYDAFGRRRAVTDPDGYVTTTDYDAFDRPTQITYPDGTFDTTTYDRLDVASRTDRLMRVTRYYYDPLQRLTATRDAAGRTIKQQWCTCGSLDALIDANGHATRWTRDLQGRTTQEIRADSTTTTAYTYEATTSRLATVTDAKGQVEMYTYAVDDAATQVAYANAAHATPTVSYYYDAVYPRMTTMVDGTGTTAYAYKAVGGLGANQVASVDGPLANDTITYDFDELGRMTGRAINGVGLTQAYDALGRVTSETNVLGTFAYTYR